MPPCQSRGEAAAINLLSSHPMDPPKMDSRFPVDFGRGHKKRYSSRKLLRRGYDVPRGFSCSSQVLMFFAFVAVGAEGWRWRLRGSQISRIESWILLREAVAAGSGIQVLHVFRLHWSSSSCLWLRRLQCFLGGASLISWALPQQAVTGGGRCWAWQH